MLAIAFVVSIALTFVGIPFGFGFGFERMQLVSPYFGYDQVGAKQWSGGIEDSIVGSIFTCPLSCRATGIVAHLWVTDFAVPLKAAIYSESAEFIASTIEITVDQSPMGGEWYAFDFTTGPDLTIGVEYALVIWSGEVSPGAVYIECDDGVAQQQEDYQSVYQSLTYDGQFPATLSWSRVNRVCSIVCTYEGAGPVPQYRLTITSTTGGSTSPAEGMYLYDLGTVVTVTATADQQYEFERWELDGINQASNPIQVNMDRNHTLHAIFVQEGTVTHTLEVRHSPGGTTNPGPGIYTYIEGEQVSVTAIPDSGYVLEEWQINNVVSGSSIEITVTMDQDIMLRAKFEPGEPPPLPPPGESIIYFFGIPIVDLGLIHPAVALMLASVMNFAIVYPITITLNKRKGSKRTSP